MGLATVLTVILALPVLLSPAGRVFGPDTAGRHHDPFTAMEQFALPLRPSAYLQPLTDIPGALISRVTGPVAAYNWLVLLTFPLAAAGAYLLARHVALAPPMAALAALVFAFSPFHLAHAAYHPHIAQTQWIPVYLLALWRCLDRATLPAAGLLAASAAGVSLSNLYGGLIAAVVTPAALLAYWAVRSRGLPSAGRRLGVTTAVLVVVAGGGTAAAFSMGHAALIDPGAFALPRADLFRYSATWWSYLVPAVSNPFFGGLAGDLWHQASVRDGVIEQQVSLGLGFIGLAVAALLAWLTAGRRPSSLTCVPVLGAVGLAAFVCSLSPEWVIGPAAVTRPSGWIYAALPMFRSYARFGVVVQLVTALLAAIGAQHLWSRGGLRSRVLCGALLALGAMEYAVWPPALSRDVLPTRAHRWAVQQPGPVRVLDCDALTAESRSVEWLTRERVSMRHEAFDECTGPNIASRLAAAGYSHMLVRRSSPESAWFRTRGLPPGLRSVWRSRDAEVFVATVPPASVETVATHGFYPREYGGSASWRWMRQHASWEVTNFRSTGVAATLAIDLGAFGGPRTVHVILDGVAVQAVAVAESNRVHHLGPFDLSPGRHQILFRSAEAATAGDVRHDARLLSIAFGHWAWTVEAQP